MAKASRQPANHVQQAKAPAASTSAPVIARRPVDTPQQAVGNQVLQRLLRAPAAGVSEVPTVSPDLERNLDAQAGGGEPLTREERSFFEPRFGRDLGDVRVHSDQQAASAARDVSAQAFTRGQDIYFGEGQYQPHSDAGRRLMAHELTHTVQQSASPDVSVPDAPAPQAPAPTAMPAVPSASAGIQRSADASVIRRSNGSAPAAMDAGVLTGDTIKFNEIEIPDFKAAPHRKALYDSVTLRRPANYKRGNPAQRALWKDQLPTAGIISKLEQRYAKATGNAPAPSTYIFENPGPKGRRRFYLGDLGSVAKDMTLPYWTAAGAERTYDVDHIVEMQLDGTNALSNMELLDNKVNSSSGATIENNIKAKAEKFLQTNKPPDCTSVAKVVEKYHMQFARAISKGATDKKPKDEYWSQDHIKAGEHITDDIGVLTAEKLDEEKVARVFPSGGTPKSFKTGKITREEKNWLDPYVLISKDLKTEPANKNDDLLGSLTFTAPKTADWEPITPSKRIDIPRVKGSQYAGIMNRSEIIDDLKTWKKTGFSPITVTDLDISPEGMVVTGKISLEEISILQGVSIDFEMSRGKLTFSKEFSVGDFKLPKPFTVKDTTLKVSAGTATGVTIAGKVDFSIDKVGEGYVGAALGTSTGFGLEGGFSFDPKLFAPPAKIDVSYINKEFKAHGVLTIPKDKVKGIKTATITADYASDMFTATGTAELDMPAVEQASMEVKYSDAVGLDIKGQATLKAGIPGIKSGKVEAEVKQADGGWSVSATGTATSTIKGFDTALTISYTDGLFTAEATAGYKTDKLSGTITVGATNRAVDEDGKPTGGASEKLSAFGSGSIEATLTPWLKGSIGVRIKPEGGVIVSGTIGLPAPIELFPKKEVKSKIFGVNTTFPTPIPGVIVTVGGDINAFASFGPGQLKDAKIGVTYDPDHEDDTTITGGATFYVPAEAGISVGVHAGVGVGVPGGSISGNIELEGGLGIKGFGSASAAVNWTPKSGLDLKADVTFEAQPSFNFKINGFFLVEVVGFEIWKPKWNLASFDYGSNLTVGITFPAHYSEREGFNPSWKDVTFKKPEINFDQMMTDVIDKAKR